MMNLHIQVYLQREKTVGIAHKWLLPNLQDVRFRGAGWNSCESRRSEKQQQHCVAQAAAGRRDIESSLVLPAEATRGSSY
jgi:predicted nucleic acid-binding Zn ribbon protein